MSPTHHSSPTTAGITTSTLANFAFPPSKNPHLCLVNPTTSANPIDRSNFSCLAKPSPETYSDEQSVLFTKHDNNNWGETLGPSFDSLNISNGAKVGPLGADCSPADAAGVRKENNEHYLGVDGYSRWGGEGGPGSWVRKLGYAEKFMTGAMDFGVMSTVYNLWFESKEMVDLHTIEQTCHLVARYVNSKCFEGLIKMAFYNVVI